MTRCPGRRLVTRGRGSLAEERPDLVKQWVDEANKDVTPDNVGAASLYMATWQGGCSCKHCSAPHPSWQAQVHSRTRTQGTNCPYCSGHKVCVCQSLAALYPDLVKELDPGSIPGLNPNSVGPGSAKSPSWVCAMHGSWLAQINARVKGTGCPSCALSARVKARTRRGLLRDEYPELHAQLHPTLNGNVEALDGLTCGSAAKLWWLCKEDKNRPPGCQHEHAWQATINQRCRKKLKVTGCPFCHGVQVCPCNSISQLKPELLRFWDYSRNSTITPDNVGVCSSIKAWWHHECHADEEHVWQTSPYPFLCGFQRLSRPPCPICQGRAHETSIHLGRTTKIKI